MSIFHKETETCKEVVLVESQFLPHLLNFFSQELLLLLLFHTSFPSLFRSQATHYLWNSSNRDSLMTSTPLFLFSLAYWTEVSIDWYARVAVRISSHSLWNTLISPLTSSSLSPSPFLLRFPMSFIPPNHPLFHPSTLLLVSPALPFSLHCYFRSFIILVHSMF